MTNIQIILNINPKIVKYSDRYYLALNSFFGYDSNPAYTLFLLINEKIFTDSNDIVTFIYSLMTDDIEAISMRIAEGIEGKYIYGEDYSISWSLYNYLSIYNANNDTLFPSNIMDSKYIFPDFLNEQYNLTNTDVYDTVADTNLAYYYTLNKIVDSSIPEEDLKSFMKTFCKIILEHTTLNDFSDVSNLIYKNVLKYYANGGKDDTLIMLNLILGNSSLLPGEIKSCCDSYSTVSSGSGSSSTDTITPSSLSALTNAQQTISCKDLYMNAMYLYLQKMLSDVNFYCDWFMTEGLDGSKYPNLVLINELRKLFKEFKDLDLNLSFDLTGNNGHACQCGDYLKYNSTLNNNSYNILDNFLKILDYVETDTIEEHCNNIKLYGQEFAILLPKLMFV